ncbi:hypothetical protein CANARDRAFT_179151, partial [[Candida] arabinofermentans NRRL YB-2248]
YYFINPEQTYETVQPSFRSDVIQLYDLVDLSQSLARERPDGSKGVKLRKSYKNHIADLPGKHTIQAERTLSPVVFGPENPDMIKPTLELFDLQQLKSVFNFEKSSIHGIPGFDSNKLAIESNDSTSKKDKKRKQSANSTPVEQPELKRRHVQVHF